MPRGQLTPEQRQRQLASIRALRANPEFEAKRRAALASPETKAKMRAAKLGRKQSPETIAKRVAHQIGKPLSPEHRAKIRDAQKDRPLTSSHRLAVAEAHRTDEVRARMSEAQRKVGLTPAKAAHMARLNARNRGPWTKAHRDAVGEAKVRAYAEGRIGYSTAERRASWLLVPLGFRSFQRIGGHIFDFVSADGKTAVEVNGCRWHDHRPFKPTCPTEPRADTFASDEAYRAIARAKRLKLIELWSCDEALWPKLIGIPGL